MQPLLCDGDHLSHGEFLRRWELMPELRHAELIDGSVYLGAPVSRRQASFHSILATWASTYAIRTPGCAAELDASRRMGSDWSQPDVALIILPEHGGLSRDEGIYSGGPAELCIEVAVSSRRRDLGPRRRMYERNGVLEYILYLTDDPAVHWWHLTGGHYEPIEADSEGVLRSRVFSGLWLDTPALIGGDFARVMSRLEEGLAYRGLGIEPGAPNR